MRLFMVLLLLVVTTMFKKFVCIGDSITREIDGLTFVVRLHLDDDCSPLDFECYSPDDIEQWNNGSWFFGGLSVSVYMDEYIIAENIAGLWGLECNISDDNNFLNYESDNLITEARESVKPIIRGLVAMLNNYA